MPRLAARIFAVVLGLALAAPAAFGSQVEPYLAWGNERRSSVSALGDVDGDGVAEFVLVGVAVGEMLVISGADGRIVRGVPLEDGTVALAPAGDLDGDGAADWLAGYPSLNLTVAYSGRTGTVVREWMPGLPEDRRGDLFGHSVAGGGDVDGDGRDDVIVAAPLAGAAFVYSGRTGHLLGVVDGNGDEPAWLGVFDEPNPEKAVGRSWDNFRFGTPVSIVPDMDGDGRADVLVGEPGQIHAFSSARRTRILTIDTTGPEGSYGASKVWLAGPAGDVNGDGVGDIFGTGIDVWFSTFDGKTGELIHTWDWRGGYLNGEGISAGAMGDVDGDGCDDVMVGANEQGIDDDPGFVRVMSGRTGEVLRASGRRTGDHLWADAVPAGMDGCPVGDVNGDGITDVAVHAFQSHLVLVLSGRDFQPVFTLKEDDLRGPEPLPRLPESE